MLEKIGRAKQNPNRRCRLRLQTLVLAIGLAVLLSAGSVLEGGSARSSHREASYIGAATIGHGLGEELNEACDRIFGANQCPAEAPESVVYASCDDSDLAGSGIQGLGGVIFCNIIPMSNVHLTIKDDHTESPMAWATCPGNGADYPYIHLFDVVGTGDGVISERCADSAESPGMTQLWLRLLAPPSGPSATKGVVYLSIE